jgi:hypothetical protein
LLLLAQAAARQPLGPPDPILCGVAAVRLYTGDLWSAGWIEVFAADVRTLIIELFGAGFRWTRRPRLADTGLWHPELLSHLTSASQRLRIDLVSLKVAGIEDLIVAEAACMWRHEAPSGEAAARAYVLAGLGRAGVGGGLRAGYLDRRLAWETRGEVVLEDLWPDRAGEDDAASRMISLTRMQALINAWRVRRGFSFDGRRPQFPRGRSEKGARKMHCHNDEWGRAGGPDAAAANVIALDGVQALLPE